MTDPAHLSEFGQRNDDRRAVFPQHAPEVLGRQRQRCLGRDVRLAQSIALSFAQTRRQTDSWIDNIQWTNTFTIQHAWITNYSTNTRATRFFRKCLTMVMSDEGTRGEPTTDYRVHGTSGGSSPGLLPPELRQKMDSLSTVIGESRCKFSSKSLKSILNCCHFIQNLDWTLKANNDRPFKDGSTCTYC